MKILVIGRGGREHALVKALSFSPKVEQIHALPGSHGIRQAAVCHDVNSFDFSGVYSVVRKYGIDLVIIGPEAEIAAGLSDYLRERNVFVVGPSQEAAQLESSKIFCKEFLKRAGVSSSRYKVVDSTQTCLVAAKDFCPPFVLKADGLAAGKGVFICKNVEELKARAEELFDSKSLGVAGNQALIEEFQEGWELSYLILTNGEDFKPLPLSQDHKRLLDRDEGPNTGGMGVVAPLRIDISLEENIQNQILSPIVAQLKKESLLYRGILYVGIMVSDHGPSVLEINVRFGDPEAQVLLPLLEGDWSDVFNSLARGQLVDMSWKPICSTCIVLAAQGYPEAPVKGVIIEGDVGFETSSSYFLHAGSEFRQDGEWVTYGGRVLNAIGLGSDLKEAIQNGYTQASKVYWNGLQMRKDIGAKLLNH